MTELRAAGSDLIRILTKLTEDVAQFDYVVLTQRKMLEHLEDHLSNVEDEQNGRAGRISAEAAHVVVCAREALEELSRLAEPPELISA
jgi:selenocysteine lyase/cysteine desulfurase